MEAFFSEIEASGSLQVNDPARGIIKSKCTFQRSGGASKHSTHQVSPPLPERIWCRNPERYVFELKNPSSQSQFMVRNISPKETPYGQGPDIFAYRFIDASHSVCGVSFSQIMADPSFSIKSISKNQRGLIVLKYDISPMQKMGTVLKAGELWLSPEKGLAIVKYRTNVEVSGSKGKIDSGEFNCDVDYDRMEEGVAIPKRILNRQTLGNRSVTEEFIFEKVQHKVSDKENFTLSYYGLPEIVPNEHPRVVPRWFIVTGFLLFVVLLVLIVFRRLRRKLKASS